MAMPAPKSRFPTALAALLLACTGTARAANALAGDPCQTLTRYQSPQVIQHGQSTPLKFAGCWYPEQSAEDSPMGYSGVNGELLGRIAVTFEAGEVLIANSAGNLRRLGIVSPSWSNSFEANQGSPSFAYWEARTLVVRTSGLEGNTIHVTERISLTDSDTLEYALHVVTLSRPSTPVTIRIVYHRNAIDSSGTRPCLQ
jgi:hypothetical protein